MSILPFVHRDISWLSFNYRVLQEAKDPSVPLLERLKFLAIYSSNLDEFFRIRVANIRNLKRIGKETKAQLDFNPRDVLKEIHHIVNKQQEEFSEIYQEQIIPELRKHHIYVLRRLDLNRAQKKEAEEYFMEHCLPFVMPVLLVKRRIRPFLANAHIYLAVHLKLKENGKNKNVAASEFALVKVPSDQLPRFIKLESSLPNRTDIIALDDVVRNSLSFLFPGYHIIDTYSIKLTRDAELYIDDEFEGDLIEKIKESLNKRQVGPASRFVYDREMPLEMMNYLKDTFDLGKYDILPEGRYHNNFDFFKFPDNGVEHLKHRPLPPVEHENLVETADFFKVIKEKDQFVHFPYQSYEPVLQFFETLADDPNVTHIKVVQYRVAKNSRIIKALLDAAKKGKQVSVFVEVKARFDEAANIEWGEKLQKAGVRVIYSIPGVKVHSKLALVRRIEHEKSVLYCYMSTGNFHEDTAKIYGDYGLFTTDIRLTQEVSNVFSFLENSKIPDSFHHLLVGKFNLRERLYELIDREIAHAQAGKIAKMVLKLNSLQDKDIIKKLYDASNAGVKIDLIVRGICCLVPGAPGYSENIQIISIVDRFLEHARVFIFYNDGQNDLYLSSADWMTRNLSFRIETAFPIYDDDIKAEIMDNITSQLRDNLKARIIDRSGENRYRQTETDVPYRSQIEQYYYYSRRKLKKHNENKDSDDWDGSLPKASMP